MRFDHILRRAEEGDAGAIEALARMGRFLGIGLAALATGLAPDVIVIVGDVTAAWDRVGPFVTNEVQRRSLPAASTPNRAHRSRDAAAIARRRHAGRPAALRRACGGVRDERGGAMRAVIVIASVMMAFAASASYQGTAFCAEGRGRAPARLLPADEASQQPDFFTFRARLQTAVAAKDVVAIIAAAEIPTLGSDLAGTMARRVSRRA